MILIKNIIMLPGYNEKQLLSKLKKKIYNYDISSYKIQKESLDSRKHKDIHYVLNVIIESKDEEKILKKAERVHDKNITLTKPFIYTFPHIINTDVREFLDVADEFRPVIVGSGPAGYHAAIKLALAGFKPIVLERGNAVEDRLSDIERFWSNDRILNSESNVCFGEGGAGTFSDGKLNTGNKDKEGYFKEVLDTFVRYGADPSIGYMAKPHIGTDELRRVLVNMRKDIIKYGGEIRFGNKLIEIVHETSIETFGYESELPIYELIIEDIKNKRIYNHKTHSLILATGHSARDIYKMLDNIGFGMEQKAFALGVRVEHNAETINKAMYGEEYRDIYGDNLPAADYKLVYHTNSEKNDNVSRSVFSFCMCPGGYVVDSSTEEKTAVVNGMSYSGRDGMNSNSAIVVNIDPKDFDGDDIMAGVRFQKELEEAAFREGKSGIPVQLYGDLSENRVSDKTGSITPQIKGNWSFGNLRNVLPDYVVDSILEAMPYFGTKIKGYDNIDTVISAVESRTSSPIRIIRNTETLMADNFPGIFPCGEGAGYAGGITSAAADGIRCHEALTNYLIEDLIECYKNYEFSKYA